MSTPRVRPRSTSHLTESPQKSASSIAERREIFNKYAETYHERFRAAIDFQFTEEPRQIVGMAVLLAGCCIMGIACDRLGSKVTLDTAVRLGLSGMVFCVSVYCFLQTRDGLLVRPHPGFWRLFHGIGLVHLILFSILAALPVDMGRQLVGLILPGLSQLRRDVFAGSVDLQCELSWRTLKIQMSKMWFYSHILGWFAKMLIFRDWYFCLILSVAFETVELSFQWLIPELKCIILQHVDAVARNVGGTLLFWILLISYDWLSLTKSVTRTSVGADDSLSCTSSPIPDGSARATPQRRLLWLRRLSKRFLPFLWSQYHWSFFRTPERFLQATLLLCLALLTELNVFLMMYALDIPATHAFHKIRVSYLCFLAVSGVAESYHYVNQGSRPAVKRRIGHNAWLFVAIILVETFVVLRYGKTRFYRIVPDPNVTRPWMLSIGLLGLWCFFHFVVIGPERLDVSKQLWAKLLLLTRNVKASPKVTCPEETIVEALVAMGVPLDVMETDMTPKAQKLQHTTELEPDRAALKSVVELISLKSPAKTTASPIRSRKDLEIVIRKMITQRQRWSRLYDVGSYVVALPPLACFLPLVSLVQFYDFD